MYIRLLGMGLTENVVVHVFQHISNRSSGVIVVHLFAYCGGPRSRVPPYEKHEIEEPSLNPFPLLEAAPRLSFMFLQIGYLDSSPRSPPPRFPSLTSLEGAALLLLVAACSALAQNGIHTCGTKNVQDQKPPIAILHFTY